MVTQRSTLPIRLRIFPWKSHWTLAKFPPTAVDWEFWRAIFCGLRQIWNCRSWPLRWHTAKDIFGSAWMQEGNGRRRKPDPWDPEAVTSIPSSVNFTVSIEDRDVAVRAWRYNVHGMSGYIVPGVFARYRFAAELRVGTRPDG